MKRIALAILFASSLASTSAMASCYYGESPQDCQIQMQQEYEQQVAQQQQYQQQELQLQQQQLQAEQQNSFRVAQPYQQIQANPYGAFMEGQQQAQQAQLRRQQIQLQQLQLQQMQQQQANGGG